MSRNHTSQRELASEKQKAHSLRTLTYEFDLLYERMVNDLKSGIAFLREQLLQKDSFFRQEIKFLRNQVYSVYMELVLRDEVAFLSYRKIVKLKNLKSNAPSTSFRSFPSTTEV